MMSGESFGSGPDPWRRAHPGSSPRPRALSFQNVAASANRLCAQPPGHEAGNVQAEIVRDIGPFPNGSQEPECRVVERFHPVASHGGQDIPRRHSSFTQRVLRGRRMGLSSLAIRHECTAAQGPGHPETSRYSLMKPGPSLSDKAVCPRVRAG